MNTSPQSDTGRDAEAAAPVSPQAEPSRTGPAPAAPRGASWLAPLAVVALIAVAALGFALWQWHVTRAALDTLREEVARRVAALETDVKQSRAVADQARETASGMQARVGAIENRMAESQGQQIALESLYQDLTRNRDEWSYAEIEQSLLIANQQLQLAGNVKAALIALQNADNRLQHMDRPHLVPLRKAINRDMERLKALPEVDTVGISVRLDNLVSSVDELQLAAAVRPPPPAAGAQATGGNAWSRLLHEAWYEIRQLVRIQEVDKPEPPLLAPSQSYFLRENLKLRLMGARLAALAHDEKSYKDDLAAARDWLQRYFDTHDRRVSRAIAIVGNLRESEISIEIPDISDTIEALRDLRPAPERDPR